jgi:ATP-binding cassette subfamily F protein 3
VGVLSGGEKARLALAKMLLRPTNLLVLDEPTSHLDVQAREVLEEALLQFAGTLVFVSHDRSFINALATRVVEVHSGELTEYLGDYDDYLRRKAEIEAAPGRNARPSEPASGASATPSTAGGSTPARPENLAAGPQSAKQERQRQRERRKARDRTAKQIARLEHEIHEREQEIETLSWRLADPEVYRSQDRLQALTAQKTELQSAIDARYRDWESLAEELESLEAGLE